MQQNVAKTGWELTKVARIGRSRSVYDQKRVEGGVGQSREPKLSVCCLHTSAHPFLAKNRPGAPVFGHCPIFYLSIWPLRSFWWTTAVLLRQLCKKKACRAATAYAAFAATATTAAATTSAVLLLLLLLLLCCCWAAAVLLLLSHTIRLPLLRVAKKILRSFAMPTDLPFFDTRFVFFVIWWNFGDSFIANTKWCRNESGLFQVRWNYWLWVQSFEWFLFKKYHILGKFTQQG